MTDKISPWKLQSTQLQLLLLLLWMLIGTGLRFANLTAKPPWIDELATMVYSLGNTFTTVPLDKAIAPEVLMQPLQPNPAAGIGDVMHHLRSENHHPPLYFVLAHLWMRLFEPAENLISLWGARSLPALFGVASIPAVYVLSRLAFGSQLVGQMAAAMMAVSPYGIFIAQEARHYTLGILWVIASLSCLVIAARHIESRTSLSIWLVLSWVLINTLGIATHYFFILTLGAEAIVLIALGWRNFREKHSASIAQLSLNPHSPWWGIYAAAAGTLAGGLVWLQVWQQSYHSEMTEWIQSGERSFLESLNPVFQSFATWLTMLYLLPVAAPALPVVLASGAVMLIFLIWVLPILIRGIKTQWQQPETRLATGVLGGFVLGACAIFFAISYGLGLDLTRGARYSFVYFPAVIAILGAILARSWNAPDGERGRGGDVGAGKDTSLERKQTTFPQNPFSSNLGKNFLRTRGKKAVALILVVGFVSGITVVCNLGYPKYYRPDILVPAIQQASSVPVLIATTHYTLVQTGEMMGIAWELKRAPQTQVSPQFLLAHQEQNRCEGKECRASTILQQTVMQLPRPVDLWLVNFHAPVNLEAQKCFADKRSLPGVYGYDYKLYHCRAAAEIAR